MLARLGAVVIDADQLAREVVAPGTDGLAAIVAAFGPGVLAADGSLDRARMASVVFADAARRAELEAIIHPRVRALGQQREHAAPPGSLIVHDIPLLVETGQADSFDAVIVVDAPVETALGRMVSDRGMDLADAQARVAAQATRDQRRAVATHLIRNDGSLDELQARVEAVYADLTRA